MDDLGGASVDKLMSALLSARNATVAAAGANSHSSPSHHSPRSPKNNFNGINFMDENKQENSENLVDRIWSQFQPANNDVGPVNPLLPHSELNIKPSTPNHNGNSSLKLADIAAVLQGFSKQNGQHSSPPPASSSLMPTLSMSVGSPHSGISPIKTPRASNKAAANEATVITKSLDEVMRRHYNMLSVLCRLCGEICGGINPNTKKRSYAEEIRVLFRIDIELDRPLSHPQKICYKCRSLLDRVRKRIKHAKKVGRNKPQKFSSLRRT